jgi:basic amino acid/polyamine antiporter, APA family
MFGAGTAIGVSIFSVLAPAAKVAGSGLLIAVLIAAAPMAVFAIVYSFLSSVLPKSGASYEWPRHFIHPFAGFLVAWLRVLSNVGAIVVLSFVMVSYLRSAFALPERATMAAAITLVFALNYLGVAVAARVQTALMAALLGVFALFVVKGAPLASAQQIGALTLSGWKAIAAAVPLMITLFMGIESAAEIGEEVREAERTVPRGIILAVLLTALVYCAVAVTALGLIGPHALGASSAPLLDAARVPLGGAAVPIILIASTVAILKTLNSTTVIFSRSLFAMGRSGALPRILGAVHPRYGTPHVALMVCYLAAMGGLLLPRNLTFLLLSVNIPTLIKYMASSLCAVRLAQRHPALLAAARIRLERKTVLLFGYAGMVIGLALLGIGLTDDLRPYELIGAWSVLGLLYWWALGARGSRKE